MTEKQLNESLNFIKEIRGIEEGLEKSFKRLNDNHNYGMLTTVETKYLELLKIAMNDKHDWISYYIYDCGFGVENKKVIPNKGKPFKLKNVSQLYRLIKDV